MDHQGSLLLKCYWNMIGSQIDFTWFSEQGHPSILSSLSGSVTTSFVDFGYYN